MRLVSSLALLLTAILTASPELIADDKEPAKPKKPAVEMNDAEKAFAELMTGADLVGSFSVDGRKGTPKEDRYTISKAEKVKDGKWMIHSRVKYGDVDVVVPVPVNVDFAGGTPVLSVRDLSIPLLGKEFGACILFDGERYAGTWSHGKVGGHMWGRIERTRTESSVLPNPDPAGRDKPEKPASAPKE
jgi:hypothetical protein